MDPNLVLSDEQKKARFRKMIEKKGPSTSSSSMLSSQQMSSPNHDPYLPRSSNKLHATDARFGGQIRRSRTIDSISQFVKDSQKKRRYSGNKNPVTTMAETLLSSPDHIGKHDTIILNQYTVFFMFTILFKIVFELCTLLNNWEAENERFGKFFRFGYL